MQYLHQEREIIGLDEFTSLVTRDFRPDLASEFAQVIETVGNPEDTRNWGEQDDNMDT